MKQIIELIKKLFNLLLNSKIKPTGLIMEVNPDLPLHDKIFGWPPQLLTAEFPKRFSWRDKMPPSKLQGGWPFCVSFATTGLQEFNSKQAGTYEKLSPVWLAAASGTNKVGNSLSAVLGIAKNRLVREIDFSFPNLANMAVNDENWSKVMDTSKVSANALSIAEKYKIKDFTAIPTNSREYIKLMIMRSPVLFAVGLSGETFEQRKTTGIVKQPKNYSVYHCLLGIGWDENDNWEVADSLSVPYYYFDKDYELVLVMVAEDLPDNWKEKQNMASTDEYPVILSHYDKERVLSLEQNVASELSKAFKSFKNQSVLEAAGRFWLLYINAVAYGGYTITDCVNDCYLWRRTGKHAFDFNQFRKWSK